MGRPSNFDIYFNKAVALDELKADLADNLSDAKRRVKEESHKRISNQFTPGKTLKSNQWRRPFLSTVIKLYPSMIIPPLPRLLQMPEIQAIVAREDVPPFWKLGDDKAIADFRVALKQYGFLLQKAGRPIN